MVVGVKISRDDQRDPRCAARREMLQNAERAKHRVVDEADLQEHDC